VQISNTIEMPVLRLTAVKRFDSISDMSDIRNCFYNIQLFLWILIAAKFSSRQNSDAREWPRFTKPHGRCIRFLKRERSYIASKLFINEMKIL